MNSNKNNFIKQEKMLLRLLYSSLEKLFEKNNIENDLSNLKTPISFQFRHFTQQYLFMKLSQLEAKDFVVLAKAIMEDKPEAKKVIDRMVNEIVDILKNYEYESKMSNDDDDDDNNSGYGNDDDFDDLDDLDDIDLSSLGF